MKRFLPDKVDFQPHLLNSNDPEKRDPQIDFLYNFFRQIFETSNPNLIHNADYLCATEKKNGETICVGLTKQGYELWFRILFYQHITDIIRLSFASRRFNEIVYGHKLFKKYREISNSIIDENKFYVF